MSTDVCEGCRRLRKKCFDNCLLRPCLEELWPDNRAAQGNATQFLAKSYGRNRFHKFLKEVADCDRKALVESLLHESCARAVNPASGIFGLIGERRWDECVAAVKAVLDGDNLFPSSSSASSGVIEQTMPPAPSTSSSTASQEGSTAKKPKKAKRERDELPRLEDVPRPPQVSRRKISLDLNLSLNEL